MSGSAIATQRSLFPVTIELSAADAALITDLADDLKTLGYELEFFGNNTFIVQGTPADVAQGNEKNAIEKLLEQYKHYSSDLKFSKREKLLRTLAMQHAIKAGQPLTEKEMKAVVEELFACDTPSSTPNGKPTYTEMKKADLDRMFGR